MARRLIGIVVTAAAVIAVACTGDDDVGSTQARAPSTSPSATPTSEAATQTDPAAESSAPTQATGGPAQSSDYSPSSAARRLTREAHVDVAALVSETTRRVASELPGANATVYLDVDPTKAFPEIGIGGFTASSGGTVFLYLNPDDPRLPEHLRTWLPPMLARELDHSVRYSKGPGRSGNLLEDMIAEGVADAFAHQIYPAAAAFPWDDALAKMKERRLWRAAQPLLYRLGPFRLRNRWMFGGGDVPRYTGYTIGLHIVQGYLDGHPDASAADVSLLDADEILAGSDYSP